MQLPLSWKPAYGVDLVRVGPNSDGGYVIGKAALESTRRLVSGGLFDDWRFEVDFRSRTGCVIDMYDASVTPKFWLKRYYYYLKALPSGKTHLRDLLKYGQYRAFFRQSGISHHRNFISYAHWQTSICDIVPASKNPDTFLKIDIEGSEYRILDDIIERQSAISGFVIEFHDVDLHLDRISGFIAQAAPWFQVEHVHANNYGGFSPDGLATAIEISFGRVDLSRHDIAPHVDVHLPLADLDFPNDPAAPDPAFAFA